MDYLPQPPKTLIAQGRYDAFPVAAAHDDTVLGLWRSAKSWGHAVDMAAVIKGVMSTDGGKTYGSVFTVSWDDGDPLTECSPTGLAWDAQRSLWVLLVLVKRFASSTATDVSSYEARLLVSSDAKSWLAGDKLPAPGAAWWFASDLAVDRGRWIITGYGRLSDGGVYARPLTSVSSDMGRTWSTMTEPSGMPSINISEPQIAQIGPSGWLMMVRGDGNVFHQCRSSDGVTWRYDSTAFGGASGSPEMEVTGDGTLVLLVREQPVVDNTHGRWLWATSEDGGMSWTLRDDFRDRTRYMMYGGLARTKNGDLACIYASEDDPSKMWVASNVYATRFVYSPLSASSKVIDGVPCVEVLGGGTSRIVRVSSDPVTGREVREPVRVRMLVDGGGALDFELQQGRAARYEVGDRVTHDVVGEVLPETMLISPIHPAKSIQARIVSDADRTHPIVSTQTDVPSTATEGIQWPVVTYSGRLGAPQGTTIIRTKREVEKARLLDVFSDLVPVFWSHHPGLGMPDWIALTDDIKEARFAQICPCGCGHGLDDIGYWRDWELKWVAQPRPDIDAFPFRRRIGEIDRPLSALPYPVQEV